MTTVPFNVARALKNNDNSQWTVLDMLKDAVERIENGTLDPNRAVLLIIDSQGQPFERRVNFLQHELESIIMRYLVANILKT